MMMMMMYHYVFWITHCDFLLSRGFKKVQVHIRQVPMENPLSLPPPLRPRSLPLAF